MENNTQFENHRNYNLICGRFVKIKHLRLVVRVSENKNFRDPLKNKKVRIPFVLFNALNFRTKKYTIHTFCSF